MWILKRCANNLQSWTVQGQVVNKWLIDSPLSAQRAHTLDPCQFLFMILSHVRRAPMTSQRKALILRGTLMRQTMLENGHSKPPSFIMKYAFFTEKDVLASRFHTVRSLEPSIWVRCFGRSWKNSSQCPNDVEELSWTPEGSNHYPSNKKVLVPWVVFG